MFSIKPNHICISALIDVSEVCRLRADNIIQKFYYYSFGENGQHEQ